MHLNLKSSSRTQWRSSVFLFFIIGNLLFSSIFLASMGMQVVKTNSTLQQDVEAKATPPEEQKLVTLVQIN
jgi:hypothetical protein